MTLKLLEFIILLYQKKGDLSTMQKHIWAKTILSSYRFLERVSGALDKIIEKKALSSSSMLGSDILTNNTLTLTDKIIELSERKITLINLKVLVERALEKIAPNQAQILIKRYFEKQAPEDIIADGNFSRRTYFRRVQEGEEAFELACASLGFDSQRLEKYLEKENWIKQIKSSFEKQDKLVCER